MRFSLGLRAVFILLGIVAATSTVPGADSPRKSENVIIVTFDGFRWQDFFGGADESLLDAKLGGIKDVDAVKKRYWRPTAVERRETLLPFLWTTVAKEGQIFGDVTKKSPTRLTNGHKFSYPGYSEMFCGFADERIKSNAKKDNPNPSVLEFLNGRPGFKDKVAAFTSWDAFPAIFRSKENGLLVQAAWDPIVDEPLSDAQKKVNEELATVKRIWPDCAFDNTSMIAAQEHLRRHKPRVLYVSLGETDEWGHGRRYDNYLDSAQKSDKFLADLWTTLQSDPQYRGKTSLIVLTDHGRGPTRADWTNHGAKVPTAEFLWIAMLGPDVRPLGVRENVETTQSQVAATIADLIGEDFRAVAPKAAAPLPYR
jgi:Type I phosphodiesterase / nucleotide pyrophosphatase